MAEITMKLRIDRWRLIVARVWVIAAAICENTLPGSVDMDGETERIAEFLLRGIRLHG